MSRHKNDNDHNHNIVFPEYDREAREGHRKARGATFIGRRFFWLGVVLIAGVIGVSAYDIDIDIDESVVGILFAVGVLSLLIWLPLRTRAKYLKEKYKD